MRRALGLMCAVCVVLGLVIANGASLCGFTSFQSVSVVSDGTWWGITVRHSDPPVITWTNSAQEGDGEWGFLLTSDYWTGAYIYEVDSDAFTRGVHMLPLALDSLPVDMVSVPAGTFTMGALDTGDDATFATDDEYPRHEVTLSAYEIGRYPVTNAQFCVVLNWALGKGYLENSGGGAYSGGDVYSHGWKLLEVETPYRIDYVGQFVSQPQDGHAMKDHPVAEVSWYSAVCFCNWLSEKEGRTPAYDFSDWSLAYPSGDGYRLPTEAEWERAAAWSGSAHWTWGFQSHAFDWNRLNTERTNPLGLSERPYTTPVGHYNGLNGTIDSPSPVGCYDMSGNVYEWCEDWYGEDYYDGGAMSDPLGPTTGTARVLRGGSWSSNGHECRSADRSGDWPSRLDYGFRIVRPTP